MMVSQQLSSSLFDEINISKVVGLLIFATWTYGKHCSWSNFQYWQLNWALPVSDKTIFAGEDLSFLVNNRHWFKYGQSLRLGKHPAWSISRIRVRTFALLNLPEWPYRKPFSLGSIAWSMAFFQYWWSTPSKHGWTVIGHYTPCYVYIKTPRLLGFIVHSLICTLVIQDTSRSKGLRAF